MRKSVLFSYCFAIAMLSPVYVFSQDYDPNQPSAFDWLDEENDESTTFDGNSPFSQGNWNFKLKRNIKYSTFSGDDPDDDDLGAHLYTKYFVAEGFGIGLNLAYGNEKIGDESSMQKVSEYSLQAGLTYGKSFNGFNVFVEGWGGIGSEKNTYSYSGGTDSEQTTNRLKFSGALGFPIRLGENPIYFTPRIGYSYLIETDKDDENYEYIESGPFLNAKLEFYMGCGDMFCAYDDGPMDDGRYEQGANHFVFPTFVNLKLGNAKESYDGGENYGNENSITKYNITLSDYQYFVNNLAFGLSGTVRGDMTEVKDSDYKTTNTTFFVMPMLRGNLPVYGFMNNLFIEGGYGLGSSKSTTDFSGSTTEFKNDVSVIKGGIGLNYFAYRNFAFSLGVHYQQETVKDDNDVEYKNSGIIGSIGAAVRF